MTKSRFLSISELAARADRKASLWERLKAMGDFCGFFGRLRKLQRIFAAFANAGRPAKNGSRKSAREATAREELLRELHSPF